MQQWIDAIHGSVPTTISAGVDEAAAAAPAPAAEAAAAAAPSAGAAPSTAKDAISAELRARYEAAGQGQVFKYVDNGVLDVAGATELAAQLEGMDLDRIAKLHKAAMEFDKAAQAGADTGAVEALDSFDSLIDASQESKDAWDAAGMQALANGEVALCVLSGGQGTRLGFSGPKGMYDIKLPSGKTLFQLYAERLFRLQQLASKANGGKEVKIPWCIMTSPMNHATTVEFFEENAFWGLDKEHVHFFAQGTLPCMTEEGQLILESGSHVGIASDGNGGIYAALQNGPLPALKEQGIKYLHVYSVDNAICKVADPTFMGYCITKGADVGNKVVWKAEPGEKVGVVAKRDGKPHVIEYSEISAEMAAQADGNGKLVFGAGNICNHFYTVDFLEKVTDDALIYHVARKKIPMADEKGETYKPTENTGMKLECFIFDAFPMSTTMAVLEGPRESEFSPVKNAPGQGLKDSPDTARAMISAQHLRWAEAAGATVKQGDRVFEISPLQSYAGEDLEQILKGQTIDLSGES